MQTFRLFFALAACLLLTPLAALRAQETDARAEAATQQIHDFYSWYMHQLNQNKTPLEHMGKEMKGYVTRRLIKEIDKMVKGPDGLDGDYFIDAQDWDKAWEKNHAVKILSSDKNRVVANVDLSGPEMNRKLRVTLALEDKAWKIDKVENRD
jgi:hypothetical protein